MHGFDPFHRYERAISRRLPRRAAGSLAAWAQLDQLLKGLGVGPPGTLSEARIGAGLKEALQVATENSVASTGRLDGYFANQVIKILMPEKLRTAERGLRSATVRK